MAFQCGELSVNAWSRGANRGYALDVTLESGCPWLDWLVDLRLQLDCFTSRCGSLRESRRRADGGERFHTDEAA